MIAMVKDRESTTKCILEESTTIGNGAAMMISHQMNVISTQNHNFIYRKPSFGSWLLVYNRQKLANLHDDDYFLWNVIITKIAK